MVGLIEERRIELTRLRKHIEAISRNEVEIKDRDNEYENKYRRAVEDFEFEVKEIRKKVEEDEMKRQRMAENHANRDDRKKKLINISASVIEEEKEREYHQDHNSYLTNKFLHRFL